MPEPAIFSCIMDRAVLLSRRIRIHKGKQIKFAAIVALSVSALLFANAVPSPAYSFEASQNLRELHNPHEVMEDGMPLASAVLSQSSTPVPMDTPVQHDPDEKPEWAEKYFRGSFLGSFFFSYPYSGVGLPDIVVMAVAALLALRLILGKVLNRGGSGYALPKGKRNRGGGQRVGSSRAGGENSVSDNGTREMGEAFPKGTLSGGGTGNTSAASGQNDGRAQYAASPARAHDAGTGAAQPARAQAQGADTVLGQWASVAAGVALPPGFDAVYFLEWARSLYISLQYSWAERQVDALESYVSKEMFSVLKSQAEKDPRPVPIDIQFVHGRLADVRHNDHWAQVGIQFTVSMSSGAGGKPVRIKEAWRFVCGGEDSSWRVEAIEQS